MAGFYSTLALFVGAIVLVAMLKVTVSEAELVAAGNARPRHAYMGRLGIYVVLAVLQALLVSMGDLFYLGIQCVHPVMFVITCCLTSLVFVNITYSLTASFGDVGKAICVFLLVIQVAGAGGTFPKEMLPAFFQTCYPFLPFVHAISCMHECIGGYYEATWAVEMTGLLTYILPCLLLGLILRKPVIRLNGWFVKKLEDTKLM
jgi:putative membrane protein